MSNAIRTVASTIGALRDAIRGAQVSEAGPYIEVEQTFNLAASITQTFSLTIPATMAVDNFDVSFSAATSFLNNLSSGAVNYVQKKGLALAPNPPTGNPPRFNRGMLRRIQLIQGDSVVIECTNSVAVAATVTLRVYGYRIAVDQQT